MVQSSQFYGLPSKDTSAYLQHFLELYDTIVIKDVAPASIRVCLFPFSLTGKAKQWFHKEKKALTISTRVHPRGMGKLQEYIHACPHHGIEDWLRLQNFYEGFMPMSKGHIDATARGAFLSLIIDGAKGLIEKMVANES
ncbi:uncharacterized protein [Miscanthus floridulus]|uniref:uncharacterized protein n=1 Tax=Miscanthus floridulus TaxID=154761 RepID=UPI00345A17C5